MSNHHKTSQAKRGRTTGSDAQYIGDHLEKLKTMIADATDFAVPMMYFMDRLVPSSGFMSAGKVSRDEKVTAVFRKICETLYRRAHPNHADTAHQLVVHELEQFKFCHGAYQIGKNMVTLIYYQDVDQGMAAMATMTGQGETIFSRFTAQQFAPSSDDFTFVQGNRNHIH